MTNFVDCLIINSNEDEIISATSFPGVLEKIIAFWKQNNNNKWQLVQKIECTDIIYSLSVNDKNTKLISAQQDNKIQVFENNEAKWNVGQQIKIEQCGYRLCFISESEFVFLPKCSEFLHLYSFNSNNKKFEKVHQFQIQNGLQDEKGFPIELIQSKNLLIVKNCNFINILRKQENNTFNLDQSIQFQTHQIDGSVNDDGQYLITWDTVSMELQVRKLIIH